MRLTVQPVPRAPAALVHVYLEDTTYADAPAEVLLHITRPAAPLGDDGSLTIDFDAPPIPGRVDCTVRVHVDVDGDGSISRGDYITTESYPLANPMTVRLHRV